MQLEIIDKKVNHQEEANKLLQQYNDGYIEDYKLFAQIKHMQKILEIAEQTLRDKVVDTLAKNGKELSNNGVCLKYKQGSARAKFDNVVYISDLEAKLKKAKELSKSVAKSGVKEVVDTDTGEVIQACYFEYDKDSLSVSFDKVV